MEKMECIKKNINAFFNKIRTKYFIAFCLSICVILPLILWLLMLNTGIKESAIKLIGSARGSALNAEHWQEKLPMFCSKIFCAGAFLFAIIATLRFLYSHYQTQFLAIWQECIKRKRAFFIAYILIMIYITFRHKMYFGEAKWVAWYMLLMPLYKLAWLQAAYCILSFIITIFASYIFIKKANVSRITKIAILATSPLLYFNSTIGRFYIMAVCVFFAIKALLAEPFDKKMLLATIFVFLSNTYKIFGSGTIGLTTPNNFADYPVFGNPVWGVIVSLVLYFVIIRQLYIPKKQMLLGYDTYSILALTYLFIPAIIFIAGWIRLYYALPIIFVMIICYWQMIKDLCVKSQDSKVLGTKTYYVVVNIAVFFWVFCSGNMGEFSYQEWDLPFRHPMYYDLIKYKWPIYFNLSEQLDGVKAITGDGIVAYMYYFAFYLPPALLSKLCSFFCRDSASNLFMLLWGYAGIMLAIYHIQKYLKRASYIIPLVLIFFSGLDIVGQILKNGIGLQNMVNMESWSGASWILSNNTDMWYSFNQTIPAWIIMSLFVNTKKVSSVLALCALVFVFSPWIAITIIPFTIAFVLCKRKKTDKFTNVFSLQNIFIPLMLIVVFGTYYTSNSTPITSRGGKLFGFMQAPLKDYLPEYLKMITLEVLVYVAVMWKKLRIYDYLLLSVISLIIIPMITLLGGDFYARAVVPALFILEISIMRFLLENKNKFAKFVMILLLVIGSNTALYEFSLIALSQSYKGDSTKSIVSYGHIACEWDKGYIQVVKDLFFVYNPEKTFFFKHLCKPRPW